MGVHLPATELREVSDILPWQTSFCFAVMPMAILDSECRFVELNVAMRELLREKAAGARGQPFSSLFQVFAAGIDENGRSDTHFQREPAITIREWDCCCHSPAFGAAEFRVTAIPVIHFTRGSTHATVVSLEPRSIERRAAYEQALRSRWRHELLWDLYSVSYDRMLLEMPFYREVVDRHCQAMLADGIVDVLDLGAGTGNVSLRLLRAGRRVTAVDVSRAMLARLRCKVEPTEQVSLVILEDTAERLPADFDEGFDGVTVLLALFDMQDPLAALAEAVRALRPGGSLVVTEPKRCFHVAELIAFAERHLRDRRLFESLQEDWNRVMYIAPQLECKICADTQREGSDCKPRLFVEDICELLKSRFQLLEIRMEDSHLGNCATVFGKKPG